MRIKPVFKILGGVVALLVLALVAVNVLISADAVRDRVAARVKEQSGRDLKVNGITSLLLLPNPHIVLTDVEITDPSNRAGADLKISRLALDVSFLQLFSRQVDADHVVMDRPVLTVRLARQSGGAERQGDAGEAPGKRAAAVPHFIAADAGGGFPRRDIMLNDVRIEDGTVRILYDFNDAERCVEHIDAALSLPHLVDPLTAKGHFDWKGVRVGFDLKLTSPADLDTRSARLDLALDTEAIDATFAGNIATKPGFSVEGDLTAKSQSVPSVLAWIRKEPPSATALGSGDLSSHLAWQAGEISFTQARFALSHATGQGQAVVTLKSPRPHVRAALAIETLNLDPFLSVETKPAASAGEAGLPPSGEEGTAAAESSLPAKTETALRNSLAKPEGAGSKTLVRDAPAAPPSAAATSADTPNVVPAAFDADVNVNVHETKVARLAIGPTSLSLSLRDGVLDATVGGMQLYDGQGSGKFTLDAAKPVPSFSGNLVLDGVSARPLLAAAAGLNLLSGRGKVELQLNGIGITGDEIKHSLTGHGSVALDDGSIEGINLTELIAGIGVGQMPDLEQGPGAKTAFSALAGTFTIASGVAESHDLEITSPLLQVTGRGTVDMVTGSLDFLTQPQIVAGPEGKGGANAFAGLTVPVRIEGPFAHPTFKPEIKGMFATPEQASKTVKQIGDALQKKFKGRPAGEAIGRLLGSIRIGKDRDAGDGGETPAAGRPSPHAEKAAPPAASDEAPSPKSDEPEDPDLNNILR
jgi:AsmA protein